MASPWSKKMTKSIPSVKPPSPLPYHPLWIINFVYYVNHAHEMLKFSIVIIYELNNGDWPIRTTVTSFAQAEAIS